MSLQDIRASIERMRATPPTGLDGVLNLCDRLADEVIRSGTLAARVVTQGNVTLSGLQTQDGVVLKDGDTCLCPTQTDPSQNGLYIVRSGTWERAPGMDRPYLISPDMPVRIAEGTIGRGANFALNARPTADAPFIPGRDTMHFVRDVQMQMDKEPCRVASTANIDLMAGGLPAIDTVTVAAGDRVLVKDQSTVAQNGIYTAGAGAWIRSRDLDEPGDFQPGTKCPVYAGAQAGTTWRLEVAIPVTLGASSIVWRRSEHPIIRPASGLGILGGFWSTFTTTGGAVQDVTLIAANILPLRVMLVDCSLRVGTAATGAAFQLRDATGGGGTLLFTGMSGAAAGWSREDGSSAIATLAPGTLLVLRRTDTGAGTCAGRALIGMIEA